MRLFLQLLLSGALSFVPVRACAAAGDPVAAATESEADRDKDAIETVRLAIMMDQMARLLNQPVAVSAHELPTNRAGTVKILNETILRFNQLLPVACARYRMQIADCRPYRSDGLNRGDIALSSALDEAYARMTPVWSAVCAAHAKQCPIE